MPDTSIHWHIQDPDAQSPVGDWNKVVGQHYDYLVESEGGNGQIITAKA